MESYSQNKEDLIVLDYFKDRTGSLLSVGENDGTTFSNARLLIEKGWSAYVLEPSTVCSELFKLHKSNPNVHIFNYGLGTKEGIVKFYESLNHVKGGSDRALVSTVDYNETIRWRKSGVEFIERNIQMVPFNKFYESIEKPKFNFITIDCEGLDYDILVQINLAEVECECLVIEWNGDNKLKNKISRHCSNFGLFQSHQNKENLIFQR